MSDTRRAGATGVRRLWPALLLAQLATILTTAGPAAAARREFSDPADTPALDIRAVVVQYGNSLRITARHQGDVRLDQVYRYYLDTSAADPGPEFLATVRPNTDHLQLERTDSWTDATRTPVSCRSWSGRADAYEPARPVVVQLAAHCIGSPARVSVSLRFTDPGQSVDWAPGARRRFAWVARY